LKSIETKKRPSGEGLGRNLDNTILPITDLQNRVKQNMNKPGSQFRSRDPKCSKRAIQVCS